MRTTPIAYSSGSARSSRLRSVLTKGAAAGSRYLFEALARPRSSSSVAGGHVFGADASNGTRNSGDKRGFRSLAAHLFEGNSIRTGHGFHGWPTGGARTL